MLSSLLKVHKADKSKSGEVMMNGRVVQSHFWESKAELKKSLRKALLSFQFFSILFIFKGRRSR